MENINAPKSGIAFEATLGQLIASFFLIFVLLILPIAGYEYLSGEQNTGSREVYTQASLNTNQGSVAGVSTVKAQSNSLTTKTAETVAIVSSSSTLIIVIGVIFLIISILLASTLIYDFIKV